MRVWNPDGSLSAEGAFEDGERSGVWTYYDEKGRKIAEGTEHGNAKQSGMWKEWPEEGVVSEGPYVNGVKEGEWTSRMPNGLTLVGRYVRGKQEGLFKTYREDGKTVMAETVFKQGVVTSMIGWSEDGKSRRVCKYKNGQQTSCEDHLDPSIRRDCNTVLREGKFSMSDCTRRKCDRYALSGPHPNQRLHRQCLDSCASRQSAEYTRCYSELSAAGDQIEEEAAQFLQEEGL